MSQDPVAPGVSLGLRHLAARRIVPLINLATMLVLSSRATKTLRAGPGPISGRLDRPWAPERSASP